MNKICVCATIPEEVHLWIKAMAEEKGCTIGEFVEGILWERNVYPVTTA